MENRNDLRFIQILTGDLTWCFTFIDILNFTLNMLEYEQEMGVVYNNKTATATIKRAMDNDVDLIFGSVQQGRVEVFSATLFLPFTLASWVSIGIVGLVACCIITVVKFTPKIFHDYVIGSNVKGSILNVWSIFLGGTQPILPQNNFPRFMLAKFLVFTLVIRSCIKGKFLT